MLKRKINLRLMNCKQFPRFRSPFLVHILVITSCVDVRHEVGSIHREERTSYPVVSHDSIQSSMIPTFGLSSTDVQLPENNLSYPVQPFSYFLGDEMVDDSHFLGNDFSELVEEYPEDSLIYRPLCNSNEPRGDVLKCPNSDGKSVRNGDLLFDGWGSDHLCDENPKNSSSSNSQSSSPSLLSVNISPISNLSSVLFPLSTPSNASGEKHWCGVNMHELTRNEQATHSNSSFAVNQLSSNNNHPSNTQVSSSTSSINAINDAPIIADIHSNQSLNHPISFPLFDLPGDDNSSDESSENSDESSDLHSSSPSSSNSISVSSSCCNTNGNVRSTKPTTTSNRNGNPKKKRIRINFTKAEERCINRRCKDFVKKYGYLVIRDATNLVYNEVYDLNHEIQARDADDIRRVREITKGCRTWKSVYNYISSHKKQYGKQKKEDDY